MNWAAEGSPSANAQLPPPPHAAAAPILNAEAARSQLYDTNPKVAAGMRWGSSANRRATSNSSRTQSDGDSSGYARPYSPWPQSSVRGEAQYPPVDPYHHQQQPPGQPGGYAQRAAAQNPRGSDPSPSNAEANDSFSPDFFHGQPTARRSSKPRADERPGTASEAERSQRKSDAGTSRTGPSPSQAGAVKSEQEGKQGAANPEDAPVGSSAAEAEILSRKLQFAVQASRPSADRLPSSRSVQTAGEGGAADDKSIGESGTSSSGGSGFKKIALPFFRWFGVTANTPGYRRIKVGVYHEPSLDMDTPAINPAQTPGSRQNSASQTPAMNANEIGQTPGQGGAQGNATTPSEGRHKTTPGSQTATFAKLTGKEKGRSGGEGAGGEAGSPGSDVAQAGEAGTPRAPGHPESTLSTSARDLFEPSRPRYPRKDILLHLIPIFMSHFRPHFFPWLDAAEIIEGADNGSLPALLANAICAISARFSPRAELRRGPLKR